MESNRSSKKTKKTLTRKIRNKIKPKRIDAIQSPATSKRVEEDQEEFEINNNHPTSSKNSSISSESTNSSRRSSPKLNQKATVTLEKLKIPRVIIE